MTTQDEVTRTKVAIVGFTPSRLNAPWDDAEWEIWGLNALYKFPDMKRATRWFDIHLRKEIHAERVAQYQSWNIPVYMQEVAADIPTSVAYPKAEVEARFGTDYFTNSISWMLALALHEGFESIHIYGVDMSQDDEYKWQRPNLEFWIGIAKGMGVDVHVTETSDLLRASHQYGYGSDAGMRGKLLERLADFNQRIGGLVAEINKLAGMKHTLEGARQNTQWMLQSIFSIPAEGENKSPHLAALEGPRGVVLTDGSPAPTAGIIEIPQAVTDSPQVVVEG
jgi:hypothetical protein